MAATKRLSELLRSHTALEQLLLRIALVEADSGAAALLDEHLKPNMPRCSEDLRFCVERALSQCGRSLDQEENSLGEDAEKERAA